MHSVMYSFQHAADTGRGGQLISSSFEMAMVFKGLMNDDGCLGTGYI